MQDKFICSQAFNCIYIHKATKVTYSVLLSFTGIYGWASLQSDEHLNITVCLKHIKKKEEEERSASSLSSFNISNQEC